MSKNPVRYREISQRDPVYLQDPLSLTGSLELGIRYEIQDPVNNTGSLSEISLYYRDPVPHGIPFRTGSVAAHGIPIK